MTDDNLPAIPDSEIMPTTAYRVLPPYAYKQTGLGEMTLLQRLDDTIKLLIEVLRPLVVNFNAQQPLPLLCSVCERDFAGWPHSVLVDHWFQHSWTQRKMAAAGFRMP